MEQHTFRLDGAYEPIAREAQPGRELAEVKVAMREAMLLPGQADQLRRLWTLNMARQRH